MLASNEPVAAPSFIVHLWARDMGAKSFSCVYKKPWKCKFSLKNCALMSDSQKFGKHLKKTAWPWKVEKHLPSWVPDGFTCLEQSELVDDWENWNVEYSEGSSSIFVAHRPQNWRADAHRRPSYDSEACRSKGGIVGKGQSETHVRANTGFRTTRG